MGRAATLNLTIEAGARFTKCLIWKDADGNEISLSSYGARLQIRPETCSDDILLEATTTNGRIILEPSSETGKILIDIGATVTKDIDWTEGVYDLELFDTGDADNVTRLVEGLVLAVANVTRETGDACAE